MGRFYKFFIFLNFFLTFISCSEKIDNLNIAVFTSGNVTFKEALEQYANMSIEDKNKFKDMDEYFRFIRKIALEKIILNRAYKDKLDQEISVKSKIKEAELKGAKELVFEKFINSKIVITENHYKKYSKVYDLYQIVKKTDILDENKIKESRSLLENLSDQIKNINDFMEKAKQYSDDITGREGGYIGKIRLGIMEEAIDEEIKKMDINKVSKIVESSIGFHVFFIRDIEEVKIDELIKDRSLYELIYNEEKTRLEEEWYNKLLKDKNLIISKDKILNSVLENDTVIQYKDNKISKQDFLNTVERYKISSFPEPSNDDLLRLADNMGIELIINELAQDKKIINSKELKKRFKEEKEFLLINSYIEKNIALKKIDQNDIKEFYERNKISLFTHYNRNNVVYVQPLKEVEKFIEQKLDAENIQNSRYELYKKLVREDQLKIDEPLLAKFKEIAEKR
ncbi:MAG: peptidylprolyl isomerase [Spirochaetes bacterium]|nr:peptidylprolyl isomerase [Spirochaetota bacterium]